MIPYNQIIVVFIFFFIKSASVGFPVGLYLLFELSSRFAT